MKKTTKNILTRVQLSLILVFKGVKGIFSQENVEELFEAYLKKANRSGFDYGAIEMGLMQHPKAATLLKIYNNVYKPCGFYSVKFNELLYQHPDFCDMYETCYKISRSILANDAKILERADVIEAFKTFVRVTDFRHLDWSLSKHPKGDELLKIAAEKGLILTREDQVSFLSNNKNNAEIVKSYLATIARYAAIYKDRWFCAEAQRIMLEMHDEEIVRLYISASKLDRSAEELLFHYNDDIIDDYISKYELFSSDSEMKLLSREKADHLVEKYIKRYQIGGAMQVAMLETPRWRNLVMDYAENHKLSLDAQKVLMKLLKK